MSRTVMQKLLHPGMSQVIRERGYNQVGGYVVGAGAARELNTPAALRAAYGWADDGSTWVDVVRFTLPACARLSVPPQQERPWPSYPHGFLRPVGGSIVPVWVLSTTRYSPGAEMWRIHADGEQELVAVYRDAARGWVVVQGWPGVREWRPPPRYVGTRAVWHGTEYAADVAEETVELTAFAAPAGEGWSQHRPLTWSRTVPVTDCEVYELEFRAALQGVPVRVLDVVGADVRAEVVGDDPEVASALGATMIDYGVFEVSGIPGNTLTETQLVANQLVQPGQ